ncbi:MAG: sensor domain-containing diguanylate cyclase [Aquificota bacterium]|nr:sensor domain-containing diguanylate cyclase [Aquificota bacterium]
MEGEGKIKKLLRIIEGVANKEYEKDNWTGILDMVADLFEADAAAIGEVEGGYLVYRKVSSKVREVIKDYDPQEFRVPIWRSAAGEAIKKKGYVIINDYQNYDRAVEAWKKAGLKRLMTTVIDTEGTLGNLSVGRLADGPPFSEDDGKILKGLAFIFSFIIREEMRIKKLFERAIRDPLTGLYNRYFLEEQGRVEIERAKRYGHPISLIMFDLDDFKRINDTYGHQEGDRVLIKFAKILKSKVRNTDMPVRYGGEEFIVLLPNTAPNEALIVAERIREFMENTVFRFGTEEIRITVSAGIASCDLRNCSLEELIYRADKAMYEAKRKGKNRVHIFSLVN